MKFLKGSSSSPGQVTFCGGDLVGKLGEMLRKWEGQLGFEPTTSYAGGEQLTAALCVPPYLFIKKQHI